MGYKMNISSLRKAFIFMGAVAALSLVNAQSALAANESAKDMTCQEFIDLNPKAMTPVAWWMLHEETVYKGGDTVTLNETDLTQIPKEGANKRGNSSRLTQSFHFFMFEPIFSPVNALNQPI